MIDIILVSDSMQSINVAWRHFAYTDYSAKATTIVESAIEAIEEKVPKAVVYYSTGESKLLFELYRKMRAYEPNPDIPIVVLADPQKQKLLLEYVALKNTQVIGISIDDKKLLEIMKQL